MTGAASDYSGDGKDAPDAAGGLPTAAHAGAVRAPYCIPFPASRFFRALLKCYDLLKCFLLALAATDHLLDPW